MRIPRENMSGLRAGFTLIELLIVVAIIAILAAIAVPNFLEAQTRAKVSRGKADMRSVTVALESYMVDFGAMFPDNNDGVPGPFTGTPANNGWPVTIASEYPGFILDAELCGGNQSRLGFRTNTVWRPITTPIAYFTSVPKEAFSIGLPLAYETYKSGSKVGFVLLSSMGPDKKLGSAQNICNPDGYNFTDNCGDCHPPYDPTNGTISNGEIYRLSAVTNQEFAINRFGKFLDNIPH